METRAKRARRNEPPKPLPWEFLESGVLEKICASMDGQDLRRMRLVCKVFCAAASKSVRNLEFGSICDPSARVLPADTDVLIDQVSRLPGKMTRITSVRIAQAQHLLPALAPKLACLRNLGYLHISGGHVGLTGDMMHALRDLTSLRILDLDECRFDDTAAMEALGQLQGLKRLHLNKSYPQGLEVTQAIAKLTGLTGLALSKPFCFRDEGYGALSALSGLADLHIGWSWRIGRGGESLGFLAGLGGLRKLAFTKCFISDEDLVWVAHNKSLERLDVRLCHNVSGTFFKALGGLTRLREVNLDGTYMLTDEGVTSLAGLTTLQALNLGSSRKVTSGVFSALTALRHLRHLVVPEAIHVRTPACVRENVLPHLETYMCAPSWAGRVPGRIEEHFHDLLRREADIMLDPAISSRVLTWFQRQPYFITP